MRIAFYKLFIVSLPVLLFACRKDKLMSYNAGDNIYFQYKIGVDAAAYQEGFIYDTLDYTFAYSPENVQDTLFPIPIAVTGKPATSDRAYKVVVDPDATAVEGTHYEWPALVIHAGRVKDTLYMRFKRTADLRKGKVAMTLHLMPNENFNTNLPFMMAHSIDTIDVVHLHITLSDVLTAGPDWDAFFAAYFGTFSEKKMRLMNVVVGLPLDFWATSSINSGQVAAATYYATAMGRYLQQQALNGNIIYEEDGVTPMRMGDDYQ